MAGVEHEARCARPHERSNRDAGVENTDDAADAARPEVIRHDCWQDRHPASVEEAERQGEHDERREASGHCPDRERCRHAEVHRDQEDIPPHPIGKTAKQKAADGASDTDGAEKQRAHCRFEFTIDGVGHEVRKGNERAQRACEAGRIESEKPWGPNGFLNGQALHRMRRWDCFWRTAVRAEATLSGIVFDQSGRANAYDRHDGAQNKIGVTPSERGDERCGERRHHEGSHTDSADSEPGCEPAALDEPTLHGAEDGNKGTAEAESDPEPVGRIDFGECLCLSGQDQAEGGKEHAGYCDPPGPPTVG